MQHATYMMAAYYFKYGRNEETSNPFVLLLHQQSRMLLWQRWNQACFFFLIIHWDKHAPTITMETGLYLPIKLAITPSACSLLVSCNHRHKIHNCDAIIHLELRSYSVHPISEYAPWCSDDHGPESRQSCSTSDHDRRRLNYDCRSRVYSIEDDSTRVMMAMY